MDCIECYYGEDVLLEEIKIIIDVGCMHCNEVFTEYTFNGHICKADPKAYRERFKDGVVGKDLVLLLQGIVDNPV